MKQHVLDKNNALNCKFDTLDLINMIDDATENFQESLIQK